MTGLGPLAVAGVDGLAQLEVGIDVLRERLGLIRLNELADELPVGLVGHRGASASCLLRSRDGVVTLQFGSDLRFADSAHTGQGDEETPTHSLIDVEALRHLFAIQPPLEQVSGVLRGSSGQTVGVGHLMVRTGLGVTQSRRRDRNEMIAHILASLTSGV